MTEQGTILWVTFTFWQEARTRKAILRNFPSDTGLRLAPILKVSLTNLQRTLTWLNDWTAGVHEEKKNGDILYEIILLSATFSVDIPNQSEEKEKMFCQCRENLSTPCTISWNTAIFGLWSPLHTLPRQSFEDNTVTVCSMSSAHLIEMLDVIIQQKYKIALVTFQKMAQILKTFPNFV